MKPKLFAVLAIAIIAISAFYVYSPRPLSGLGTGRNLGAWFQAASAPQSWIVSPSSWAAQFFQGPAGFTSLEVVMNENFNQEISWVNQVATAADSIQGARMEVICVLDPNMIQSNQPFAISDWENMVNTLKGHPSIISFGINGERSPTVVSSDYATLGAYVANQGKRFINYYTPAGIVHPANFQQVMHTNYPDLDGAGQPGQLDGGDSTVVGVSNGYFAPYTTKDWNQGVVDTVLQHAIANNRELSNMAFNNPLDPTFQAWVGGSQYRSQFNTAGGSVPPPTTTSGTTTSTSATTITSTSATTITSTSVSGTSTTTITSTSTSLMTTTSSTTMGSPPPSSMSPTVLIAIVVVLGGGAYLLLKRKR